MDLQRRQRLLFFGLFCCAFALLLAKVAWPQFLRAAQEQAAANSGSGGNNVGTNIGEGDPAAQSNILDMIKSKGAGAGYPVTVTVYADNSTQGQITSVAQKIRSYGFYPIVRIDHSCDASTGQVTGIVQMIQSAYGPPDENSYLIELGNEVDNKDTECK